MITCVAAGRFHGLAASYGSRDIYAWGRGAGEAAQSLIEIGQKPAPEDAREVISGLTPVPMDDVFPSSRPNSRPSSAVKKDRYDPYGCEPIIKETPKPQWLPLMDPSVTALVSRLPLPEAKVMPRPPTLGALLSKLPPTLRKALCALDVDGEELSEAEGGKEAMIAQGSTGMTLLRMRLSEPVALVACGAEHSLVALVGGCVLAWGSNERGQCGLSMQLGRKKIDRPVHITQFVGIRVISISGGEEHRSV